MLPREGWQFAGDFVGCQELAKHNLQAFSVTFWVRRSSYGAFEGSMFRGICLFLAIGLFPVVLLRAPESFRSFFRGRRRVEGHIPWHCIADGTRPVHLNKAFGNLKEFFPQEGWDLTPRGEKIALPEWRQERSRYPHIILKS